MKPPNEFAKMPWATQMSDDGVELDELSGGKNGVRKVSALQLSEVVSAGDPSASPSPRDLVKKTLHQVCMRLTTEMPITGFHHSSDCEGR